jgi:signal transduction histidine kinase
MSPTASPTTSEGAAPSSARQWPNNLPWSYRVLAWAAMTTVSALAAHRHPSWLWIVVAALLAVAAIAVQFAVETQPAPRRAAAVLVATVAGLAVIPLAPGGFGYVAVLIVAARFPYRGRPETAFLALDTIAFGAVVGVSTHSLTGALAGLGVPALAQRGFAQREIVKERDRATALLAQVQAGREAEAQAAALRERGTIARDLHDVLAHSLAGLSLQLQAIRAVAARNGAGPELTEPLDRAAQLARDGLAEARSAVSALRDPVGLGLDALPTLIERHPGEARLIIEGDPAAVDPAAGHAVYRAVQESLTNAARYAPGAAVAVLLRWEPGQLRVHIDDSGPGIGHHATPGQGTGLGLAGMAERVNEVGGTVQAGPRPDTTGWRVDVTVPVVTP